VGKENAQPHATHLSLPVLVQIVLGAGMGTGYIPIAPATFASLLAVPLVGIMPRPPLPYLLITVAAFLLGVALASSLEKRWGKDPRRVTIDELVGMLVSFFLVPFTVWSAIVGFLLFRFFDIIKLPFVRAVERLPRGWGIMLDDVAAGVCTNVILQVVFRLVWGRQ